MLPKVELLQKIEDGGIIAVVRRVPENVVQQVAESLIEGGVTALEVTVDSPNVYRSIEKLANRLGDRALVGAGTVLDSESAWQAISAGAEFVFSPSLSEDIIRTALRYGKIAIPGVMTPTEMIRAMEWGADMVKLFPAGTLGPKYLKDVKGPFPHIPVIPTGGVNLDNIDSFIEAGAVAVGIGVSLVDTKDIESGNFNKIRTNASLYVEAVKTARERHI
ncbi:bifunctional 4-hydroxy-2-oxoglutarate aldolase/2-dehydro-3-deoxy-phosphogluconate aldolase [Alkalihalobacillus sp. AL-G]|uniref:bifunctional 4-hydroxy-2-oxoglutarate aldolase/2-dehydro-3-deoxy-phosphogluconate aldolase n=1 Tax=Alkalihalobacillus sp. AL-G TaxID=2926399 RepID=UPI002729B812|nr:bifunctional 4-hydroxy-2-oxoglutarate aldolase/2-dehydro-3-deoxy-phosphogluconate aldolase [Alkalihalobacillus sp. AL-G]WLD94117.1 bifunctional 4-hydroxy-2-oxoglutarate aldolase/2-dehydro-3-deoxy-phosphogluconate aldolase [Alkalihalobacillus sp. AL-G]